MKRLALLACIVLAGCPKAESPVGPAKTASPKLEVPAASTSPKSVTSPATRFDFKGDTPGVMTVVEFRKAHSSTEEEDAGDSVPGVRRFARTDLEGVTFATVPVKEARYIFVDEVLGAVLLRLGKDPGKVVPGALIEKYGKSNNPDPDSYDHTWKTEHSVLECSFSKDPFILIGDNALGEKQEQKFQEKKRSAAKDL